MNRNQIMCAGNHRNLEPDNINRCTRQIYRLRVGSQKVPRIDFAKADRHLLHEIASRKSVKIIQLVNE